MSKKNQIIKQILVLQIIIVIYTFAGVAGKFAAQQELFSLQFLALYGVEIAILGVYAILWQQVIKRIDLSIAYANRAVAIIWSLLWAVVLFNEQVTLTNVIGGIIIIIGTIIVNGEQHE